MQKWRLVFVLMVSCLLVSCTGKKANRDGGNALSSNVATSQEKSLSSMGMSDEVHVSNSSEPADDTPGAFNVETDTKMESSNEMREREETEMEKANRRMIAKALAIEEDDRSIRFILNALRTIEAGQVQNAEITDYQGEKILLVTAEKGIKYRFYLSEGRSIEAVQNADTGEWVIKSER